MSSDCNRLINFNNNKTKDKTNTTGDSIPTKQMNRKETFKYKSMMHDTNEGQESIGEEDGGNSLFITDDSVDYRESRM